MKTSLFDPRIVIIPLALLATVQLASAGQTQWSGLGADQNWTTAANWVSGGGSTPPATTDIAVFTNNASAPGDVTTVDNVVNANTTVASLVYTNITPFYHNTQINPGVTLTVNGLVAVALYNSTTVDAMSGTGNFVQNTTTANFTIGGPISTTTMTLADGSNQVNCATVSLGESGGSNGRQATLNLGNGTNEFFATTAVNLGTGKGAGTIQYAEANGGLLMAGPGGILRVPSMLMGSGTSGSGGSSGQLLLTGHPSNIIVSNLTMGVLDDTGSPKANIAIDDGSLDATSIIMGKTTASESSGVTSTLTIGGNATATANLIVNAPTLGATGGGDFVIAASTLGTAIINGTLTVSMNGTAQMYCSIIKTNSNTENVGTINLSGGTLIMEAGTDTIGTTAVPIDNVNFNGGTLQLSVAGATPEVVATTLNVNAPIAINIGTLPVIARYPTVFPLIQYANVNGDPTTLTLGTMPTVNSVLSEGYLSNNVAISTLYLVVTSGFAPTGVDVWKGNTSSNWDLTTPNWNLLGSSVLFDDGDLVQFDDTVTGPTNVNIFVNVTPAAMTFSNFVKAYNLSGPGGIVGSASLTKYGTNSLVLADTGVNTFSGGITINAGTVQFGTGGTTGNLPANPQPIADNGSLILDSSANTAVIGAISGTGSLTQSGIGVVSLSVSNSYSGATLVNDGSLMVDSYIGGGGVVTNAVGATLGGIGTILLGQVDASGIITPGDVGDIGTLTVSNLTLYASANPTFELNAANNTTGSGYNDLLQVTGNLAADNNTISIAVQGVPQAGTTYEVIAYTGAFAGGFNPVVAGTHYAASVDTSTTNEVNVDITGSSGANMKWDSTSSSAWDMGVSKNWLNLGTSLQDYFYAGDTVLLDDSVPNVVTNFTIATGVTVYPSLITNNSATSYNIGGGGSIGGQAAIIKFGTGTLSISNANTFTGGLTINAGTLKTGNASALGSTTGQTVINSGATLDVNGQDLGSETIVVGGTGVGGNGAIVNSGPQQTSALKNVTLTADTTLGGSNRWDIRGGSATLQSSGSPVNITKVSTNQVSLVACTCNDGNLENVYIQQGEFAIQTSSTQLGDPNGFIVVSTNAFLEVWALTAGLNKNIVFDDGGGFVSDSGSSTISGTIILTNDVDGAPGTAIFTNSATTTIVLNSTVTGPGNLLKLGAGITSLASANDYTGNTLVDAGTLSLTGGGTIVSPLISVAAGAIFDVSAVTPLTLNSGQTLSGSGSVNGDIIAPDGAVIAPGSPTAIGTLSLTGSGTLGGTTVMKLSTASGGTNDVLTVGNTLTLGGALNVTILNGPLTGNVTFTLFSATNGISGTFAATNLPALNANQYWITTNLANGVLELVTTGPGTFTNPTRITSFSLTAGGNAVITGTNGQAGDAYYLLESTNLTAPIANWVPVATNVLSTSGNYTFIGTNVVTPGKQQQYYILSNTNN